MSTYTAYFRTDAAYAMQSIKAKTPKLALARARKMASSKTEQWFWPYDPATPISEIAIKDGDHNVLAFWRDSDFYLRLAAPDLLAAAEKVLDRWQTGDLAEAVRDLAAAVGASKGGGAWQRQHIRPRQRDVRAPRHALASPRHRQRQSSRNNSDLV